MIRVFPLPLALFASPAFAHPGHIAEAAGHNHWLAGAAVGAAVAIAIWGAIKGKKAEAKTDDAEPDADAQEA